MRYSYILLLLFFFYSLSSFAQDYEIVKIYEESKSDLYSDMLDDSDVDNKEYVRLVDYNDSFRKDEIYVFRKISEKGVFYFSTQKELEGDKPWEIDKDKVFSFLNREKLDKDKFWKIDISDSSNYKIETGSSYFTKQLTDKIVAILTFDNKRFDSHLLLVDLKNRKIINSFPIKTKPDQLSSFFKDLQSDGEYIVYQNNKYPETFSKNILKSDIDNDVFTIYGDTKGFIVRNLGTNEVKEYELDRSNYYTAKPRVFLFNHGKIKCIGLYSDKFQTGFYTTNESYQTYNSTPFLYKKHHKSPYANNVRGIFIQYFKSEEKTNTIKIPLTQEIMTEVSKGFDGSIDFATFELATSIHEDDKTIFITIESKIIFSRGKHEKISLCIEENGKITWWDLLRIGRGENTNLIRRLESKQEYQKEEKYITLVYSDKQIKAYKATCGNAITKIFKIPRKINGYKFSSFSRAEHRDNNEHNDIYANYKKGEKIMLVKLKTGKAFAEILD